MMQALSTLPENVRRAMRGVLTDIDDTVEPRQDHRAGVRGDGAAAMPDGW
jgi:hypothetical protein